MKKIVFSAFTILSTLFVFGQKATLTGVVKDYKTTESIPFANIVYAPSKGTTTDLDGKYTLQLDPGTYQIKVSYVGFDTIVKNITLTSGETRKENFQLKEKSEIMQQVVVSAGKFEQNLSKVTVSMETVSPELVSNKATTNAKDIISQVPSVHTQEGQVSIRGGAGFSYGAGSRVVLMVDGIPLLSGDAGDVKWNYIPVENLENIEVIKGASSVLYGSSALNGVINIRTGFPRSEPLTKINVIGSMYDKPYAGRNQKWWSGYKGSQSLNFYHSRIIKKNFDLVVGGNVYNDESFRMEEYGRRGRLNINTRYRDQKYKGLSYGLNFNSQASASGTFFAFKNKDSVLYPSVGTTADARTIRLNVDPYIEYFGKNGDKQSLKTRWFKTANVSLGNESQNSASDLFYGEYQYQKSLDSNSKLTSGVTTTYTLVDSRLFNNHNSVNLAAYSQLDKGFLDGKLNLSMGFRAEYFRLDSDETESTVSIGGKKLPFQPIVRAGLNYQAAEFTFLRASYGQGYRFPAIAEKYVSTSLSAINVFPNPGLQPETGWSAELGIKQGVKLGGWKGFLDVSGFVNQYDNMMEYTFASYDTVTYQPVTGFNPGAKVGFSSRNVQSARIMGIDVSLAGKGKIGNVNFTVLAGYTFMVPKPLNADSAYLSTFSSLVSKDEFNQTYYDKNISLEPDSVSNNLKYRFNHLAKFDIQADYNRFSAGVSFRYNSRIHNIDQAFIEIGNLPAEVSNGGFLGGLDDYNRKYGRGVGVFDGRVSYEVNEYMKASFLVENILNTEYTSRPGYPMPPRTFIVQLGWKF